MPVPAVIAGLLRVLASGGKVAKNAPRPDPRLLQGGTRLVGESTTGASPAYTPATVRTTPRPTVDTPVVPSPFRVTPFGGPEVEIEDQPVEPAVAPAVAPGGGNRLSDVFETFEIENRPIFPVPENRQAPPAQPAAPARVIVPQTRDEQLEAYENFGKNIPGTIDIGAQSFKVAGPSDIGQRATVPIPGAGATGSEDIASEVTRRLGLAPAAAAPAAAPAQDGGGFFSNLFKGGILDSESPLSRQQRVMLGVAALKDAGNALEGKATNFFGQTQQGFQEARESASDRQFKFLQQARLARESAAAERSGINAFSTESKRQSAGRAAMEFDRLAELYEAQSGLGPQLAAAAAATPAAPSVAGAPTQVDAAASDRSRVIGLAKQVLAGQIPSGREDREAAQKFISQNAGSSFLSFEQANEASKKFAEYDSAVMRTDGELRTALREIGKIDQAISRTPRGAGFFSLIDFIPETDAAELKAFVESIQSNIAFSALQKMRELSPTGGALGNVSNQELSSLQNSIQSLRTNMGPETLKTSLMEIKEDYQDVIRKIYVTNDGGYNQEAIDAFGEAPLWLRKEMNKPRDETEFGVGSNSGSGGAGPLLGVEPVSK